MSVVRTTSGKTFAVEGSENLLDAAVRAAVALPYSCKTGRCGACKGQVRSGATVALHDELGLTTTELANGWILTCVRTATSNVELDIQDLGDTLLAPARTLPCRIHALELLGTDVIRVVLRLPPTAAFDFLPGQYVDLIGHGGVRRSYSVANAPTAQKLIELHVKRVPDGAMSRYWFESAKAGDLLRLNGPLGTFFLRSAEDIEDTESAEGLDLVFLATGTGIAPVKAMLEGLAQKLSAAPRSITVYWGGRVPEDLYWDSSESGVPHRFVPVLSQAGADWAHARGYVQQILLSEGRDWSRTVVYACGSDAMIHSARQQLTSVGLTDRQFFSDAFVCSASF